MGEGERRLHGRRFVHVSPEFELLQPERPRLEQRGLALYPKTEANGMRAGKFLELKMLTA
jgi:hypothetical protein